ncbi:conserved hypothetical protein [Rhodopseudomonas palustris BisB5]|uniref:Mitochondrial inner membrane protein n=1 Tax=Rhodopseudomonas palustris (strain BisB5) TaxID=316057 RepID=Q13DY3_RHOPS|nr:conserved hypothetical protein [Rhodopseudomonas palustris BisB5]
MVKNRPGHENTQHEKDPRENAASVGASDAHPEQAAEVDVDAPIEALALNPVEPTAEELRDDPALELSAEHRQQDVIDAEPLPETATDDPPETRFASTSDKAEEAAARSAAAAEPRRPGIVAAMLPPVLAVAIAAAVVVGAAKTGLLPQFLSSTSVSAPEGDVAAIDALKARIADLEARPTPTGSNTAAATPAAAADPALAGKVDALEKTVAALRDDLATLRDRSEQLASALKEVKAAPSEPTATASEPPAMASTDKTPPDKAAADKAATDSAAALAAINARLTELEHAAKTATEAAPQAPQPAVVSDDAPLRRLVTATMLDLTVKQGAPYAAILKAAEPLATETGALKPLEPFAATGVPAAAALGRELIALLPKLLSGAEGASNANFIDRFQSNAERLIRIQRSDATAGIDRTAIVGRITAAAQRGDLAEARRELKALAPADRAPVQSWIDKSEARDQALAASHSFATAALAALQKPSP